MLAHNKSVIISVDQFRCKRIWSMENKNKFNERRLPNLFRQFPLNIKIRVREISNSKTYLIKV